MVVAVTVVVVVVMGVVVVVMGVMVAVVVSKLGPMTKFNNVLWFNTCRTPVMT